MTTTAELTVLYLVAKGRSGSNILAHALGQVPGVENTGELYQFWRRAQQPGVLCGCGEPVRECDLWGAIVDDPGVFGPGADVVAAWQDHVLSWRTAPRLVARPRHMATTDQRVAGYLERQAELYRRIAAAMDARVVLDASKWPWDPVVLGLVPGVDVRVIHMVRDPRAVAHSWQRRKDWGDRPGDRDAMPRFRAPYSATSWLARNLATELVRRRRPDVPWLRVRYEDFASTPEATLRRVLAFLGMSDADVPVVAPSTIRMRPTHGIAGNASKFQVGDVELRLDDEWRRRLTTWDRLTTMAITLPLLRRYGYTGGVGSNQ